MTWGETATEKVYMKEETKQESRCFALTSIDGLCRPLPAITPFYSEDGITLYNADCAQVLPFLEPCDLVLTDPPYGIGFAAQPTKWQRRAGQQKELWDDAPPAAWILAQILESAENAIVWGGNYYNLEPSRCWLTWHKPDAPPSMSNVELAWTSFDKNSKQISISISATNRERVGHPTQKPLALMKWCIGFAPEAKTILDPFAGSGTTLRAAKDLGLQAVGIERDERYCEIIVDRLRQQTLGLT